VFPIQLPPLRDRAEDIPALAEYFVQRAAVTRGNMQRAAEILDINPRTLYRMVARYKLRSA
jgi:DNA-binding NtrC family response regulator